MKRALTIVSIAGLIALTTSLASPSIAAEGVAAPPEGFTALFNGKDLSGWWGLTTEDPRL